MDTWTWSTSMTGTRQHGLSDEAASPSAWALLRTLHCVCTSNLKLAVSTLLDNVLNGNRHVFVHFHIHSVALVSPPNVRT